MLVLEAVLSAPGQLINSFSGGEFIPGLTPVGDWFMPLVLRIYSTVPLGRLRVCVCSGLAGSCCCPEEQEGPNFHPCPFSAPFNFPLRGDSCAVPLANPAVWVLLAPMLYQHPLYSSEDTIWRWYFREINVKRKLAALALHENDKCLIIGPKIFFFLGVGGRVVVVMENVNVLFFFLNALRLWWLL